jgi:NADPH2:quinone reductase
VQYSDINYKDALAATGAGRSSAYPLVGGIDLAGVVRESTDPRTSRAMRCW